MDEDLVNPEGKEVFDKLEKLQFIDWVDLKFKSWSEEEKRKAAEKLVTVLKDYLKS